MTRDDLIERLAERRFSTYEGAYGPIWESASDEDKEEYRDLVLSDWTLIVDFVAAWLGDMGFEDNAAGSMAAKWREDMDDDPARSIFGNPVEEGRDGES